MGFVNRKRRFPIGLLLLVLAVIGLAAAAFAAPRVVQVRPSPGSLAVPARAAIEIHFDQPMERASVQAHLNVEPPLVGALEWQGSTLLITPLDSWPAGAEVQVQLLAGARSMRNLPLLRATRWSFSVSQPRLIYLWPSNSQADLYSLDPSRGGPQRLTQTEAGVLDFSVDPAGTRLIYAAARRDQGSDLWALDLITGEAALLYACPLQDRCHAASISPDSAWLAFERQAMLDDPAAGLVPGKVQVWLLPLNGQGEPNLVHPVDHLASNPIWSPIGELGYYDESEQSITIVALQDNAALRPLQAVSSELGLINDFSPDGLYLIYPEVVLLPEDETAAADEAVFFSHLYRVGVNSGLSVDLSGDRAGQIEDTSARYAPDGSWIAFARKFLAPDRWTPGRQIWLMRSDGEEARPLTSEPEFMHASLAWSPDSNALAYTRFNPAQFSGASEIWWLLIDGGRPNLLVEGGYLPQWVP